MVLVRGQGKHFNQITQKQLHSHFICFTRQKWVFSWLCCLSLILIIIHFENGCGFYWCFKLIFDGCEMNVCSGWVILMSWRADYFWRLLVPRKPRILELLLAIWYTKIRQQVGTSKNQIIEICTTSLPESIAGKTSTEIAKYLPNYLYTKSNWPFVSRHRAHKIQ